MASNSRQSLLECARTYLRRAWCPIAVEPHGKVPQPRSGWEKLRLTEADLSKYFPAGNNIGIHFGEASNGLVDIDLDTSEAIALADYLLPTTASIFGRRSKPRSHRLYRIPGHTDYLKFTDPLLTSDDPRHCLVELRQDGHQSIVPPSGADGETRTWDQDGEPTPIQADVLSQHVRCLAAAALLSRYWPPSDRHEARLSLIGTLARGGWSEEKTIGFVQAVVRVAQPGERDAHSKVEGDTRASFAKLGRKAPVTGFTRLTALIDKRIVQKVCEWLQIADNRESATRYPTDAAMAAERTIEALEKDKKSDPVPAIEAVAEVEDPLRRALLIARLAAIRVPGLNRELLEKHVKACRTEAEAARQAAAEEAKRSRLKAMPVSPAKLVADIEDYFSKRVWYPVHTAAHAPLALSLFALLTYFRELFNVLAYVCIESATPGCGKSTLLDLLAAIVHQALQSAGVTSAALIRALDEQRVTFLLDESEWLEAHDVRADNIRSILRSGSKKGAKCQVCEGDDHHLRHLDVFGPKAFCAVGGLYGGLLDRCVVIHMEKAPAGVKLLSASVDDLPPIADPLREKLEAVALQLHGRVEELRRQRPPGGYWPEFTNREADLWHPLLTVARACGPEVEERALTAARHLSKMKQAIQADERRTAQTRELADVLMNMESETFRPADLVEVLEEGEAWSEVLATKKEPRLKAGAIGSFTNSFRPKSRDRQRSGTSYNRLEVLEILKRYIPLEHPEKGATGATGATDPMKTRVPGVAPPEAEVPHTADAVPPARAGVAPPADGVPLQNPHPERVCGTVAPVAPFPGGAGGISPDPAEPPSEADDPGACPHCLGSGFGIADACAACQSEHRCCRCGGSGREEDVIPF